MEGSLRCGAGSLSPRRYRCEASFVDIDEEGGREPGPLFAVPSHCAARRIAMYSFNARSREFIVHLPRLAKGEPVCADHRSRAWRKFPWCWGFDVEELIRFHSCWRQNEASSWRDCVSARGH